MLRMSISLMVVFTLLVGTLSMAAYDAEAYEGTYYTYRPSSNNSTIYRIGQTPGAAYGSQLLWDGYTTDFSHTSDAWWYLETSDFNNPEWYGEEEYGWQGFIGDMPPDNATIVSVSLIAFFVTYQPFLQFFISANDEVFNEQFDVGFGTLSWNVTALYDWTPQMLSNETTAITLVMYTEANLNYRVSYLGFGTIHWTGWDEELPSDADPPAEDDDGYDAGYDIVYTNIPGLLGFIGFIGLIAVPAAGIWVARNGQSESHIELFVKILAAWFFCFALVLYAVA